MTAPSMARRHDDDGPHVCPFGRVRHLDNWLRPLIHNPKKLFGRWLRPGMTALDVGCGGGFASMAMARLVGGDGRVIAADLQQEMLEYVRERADREGLAGKVRPHRCQPDRIGVTDEIDFAVAFFMAHEVPDLHAFFKELWDRLTPGGRLFLAEPLLHVGRKDFERELELARAVGFTPIARPWVLGGRAVVLERR